MANADVNTSIQGVPKQTELQGLVKEFQEANYHLANLLGLAREKRDQNDVETLVLSARHFLDKEFDISERIKEFANSEAVKGGA